MLNRLRVHLAILIFFESVISSASQPRPEELNRQLRRIASSVPGRVGAAVQLLPGGAISSYHGQERFPMQSVYKLPIAMAALQRVDRGELRLDGAIRVRRQDLAPAELHSPLRDAHPEGGFAVTVRDLLRYALVESDGTASDLLLRLMGGTGRAAVMLRELGIHGIRVANTESELARDRSAQYRNWATPESMLALWRAVDTGRGLSTGSHNLLWKLLLESNTGLRRIRGELPPGTAVAHKTGTSGTVDGITAATNDAGIVILPDGRHLAVVVFVSDSPADENAREAAIAQVAHAAWDAYAERVPGAGETRKR